MNSLVVSLGIAGGVVLAGVVAYNAWVTRRSAPRTAKDDGDERSTNPEEMAMARAGAAIVEDDREHPLPTGDDPMHRVEPILGDPFAVPGSDPMAEPMMGADPDESRGATSSVVSRVSQTSQTPSLSTSYASASVAPISDRQQPRVAAVTLNHVVETRPGLDALIDSITSLTLDGPVSGEAVLAAYPATRRVGSKAFAIEGQQTAGGDWEIPRPGRRYVALQAGVQLANRSGALNDIEFSEYVMKTQAFADAVNAAPDFPDMRAEVARARELDTFASGHDAQLSLTLRARRAAWSPGYVQQHAAKLGFVAGALPGRIVLPGSEPGAAPVLVLSFDPQAAMAEEPEHSALRHIRLSLEATHVPRGEQPFVKLRQAAKTLSEQMDGLISDDAGHVLGDEAMDSIGADLENLYEALEARDLAAGSPQARRLFS